MNGLIAHSLNNSLVMYYKKKVSKQFYKLVKDLYIIYQQNMENKYILKACV